MPTTTRVYLKMSILYLAAGAILGALMFIQRWIPLGPAVDYFRVPHIQLLIVGWLTQLILGVAWWLFPPLAGRGPGGVQRRGQVRRGSEPLFWTTFAFLNAGVLLRAVCEPLYSATHAEAFGLLTALSGFCLLAAALTFVLNVWARVRELG